MCFAKVCGTCSTCVFGGLEKLHNVWLSCFLPKLKIFNCTLKLVSFQDQQLFPSFVCFFPFQFISMPLLSIGKSFFKKLLSTVDKLVRFFLEGVQKPDPAWLKLMNPFYAGTEMLLVRAT